MTFLDTNLLHICIADQVCCMLYVPFARFHNLHNNPVLTHCNIQCTQYVFTRCTRILRKIQSASRCGEISEGKIVQDAEAVTE